MEELHKNKDWLEKKYLQEKLTTEKIGKLCGVSRKIVSKWLDKFLIPRRSVNEFHHKGILKNYNFHVKYKNKKWLEEKYKKEKLSVSNISKLCKVSNTIIYYWLRTFEISINDEYCNAKYRNKEWLKQKYINEKLSMIQISKLCKVSISPIFKWLKRYNIPIRSLGESHKGLNIWTKGTLMSEEVKRKISKANKGQKRTDETKQKMSLSAKGRIFSEETRNKMSKARMGKYLKEKNNSWKGGITPLAKKIREHLKYQRWIQIIFTRDNFTCQNCGQIGGILNAHHKITFAKIFQKYKITTLEEALNCEAFWDINNGITLCKKCHKKIHRKKNVLC